MIRFELGMEVDGGTAPYWLKQVTAGKHPSLHTVIEQDSL